MTHIDQEQSINEAGAAALTILREGPYDEMEELARLGASCLLYIADQLGGKGSNALAPGECREIVVSVGNRTVSVAIAKPAET